MENQTMPPSQPNLGEPPVQPTEPIFTPPNPDPTPPPPPPAPSPIAPEVPTPSSVVGNFAPLTGLDESTPSAKDKFGWLSLALSASAVGVFILLIFVSSLVDSLTKAYIWFFIILVLGIAGLGLGLLSEKGKDKLNLLGLLGMILSVIVCVNCLVIGSYYIKLQIELNKFKNQINTPLNQNVDTSTYNF